MRKRGGGAAELNNGGGRLRDQDHGEPLTPRKMDGPAVDLTSVHQALIVTEYLSFRRAAGALGVRQSAVSHRIRVLEDKLGVSLFERKPRGVRPTQAGVRFFERARLVLEGLDEAVAGAKYAGCGQEGRLRIGIFTPLADGFLRNLIAGFSRSHPQVGLEIHEGDRHGHYADLRANSLDVVFTTGANVVDGCETAELWSERVHIALPNDHALSRHDRLDWPDLLGEHFIVSRTAPGPEIHSYIVRRAATYSNDPRVERLSVSPDTVLDMVGMGFGVAVVAASRVAAAVADVVFRPLTDPADILPFSAVWLSTNDNPTLRRFLTAAHLAAGRARPATSDWAVIGR
jgi:DNA-binding transcriptional LysR family regulator